MVKSKNQWHSEELWAFTMYKLLIQAIYFSTHLLLGCGERSLRCPDFIIPGHFLHLLQGNPEVSQSQTRSVVPSACLGLPQGFHPVGHAPNTSPRRRPGDTQTWTVSAGFTGCRGAAALFWACSVDYKLSKAALSHPVEKAHFGCLYLEPC